MKNYEKFLILCILSVAYSVKKNIKCYSCGPTDEGNCIDPRTQIYPEIDCNETRMDGWGPSCYSLYVQPGLETAYLGGFYRGCYLTENMNVAVCDYMEIYYKSIGNVTWCTRCGTDDCNDNLP
jgi:hypothetical protein